MKRILFKFIVVISVLGPMASCISEDNDGECPVDTGNVTLYFSLTDDEGMEVLRDHISKIDLVLFQNSIVDHMDPYLTFPVSGLNDAQSVVLDLEPGTYQLVAWGNVHGNQIMCELSHAITPAEATISYLSVETGDPLFYAASPSVELSRTVNPRQELPELVVPPSGRTSQTLEFKYAHHIVEVYVKGYTVEGQLPVIEIADDYAGYDFYMNHLSDLISLRQHSEFTPTAIGQVPNATFYTTRLTADNQVKVNVVNPVTGDIAHSVTIAQAVELMDKFDYKRDIRIPVYFEFVDGHFEVTLPSWLTTPSKPDLD